MSDRPASLPALDAVRLREIGDLLTYESSVSFFSARAHESMWMLFAAAQQALTPIAAVKAETIRELAEAQREIANSSRTRDGSAEATDIADWLDERANLIDPRRLEGAHP